MTKSEFPTTVDAAESQDIVEQFDAYVADRPSSVRAFHRRTTFLMAATIGMAAGLLIKALLVSFQWQKAGGMQVAFWWILFAGSVGLLALFMGLDTVRLRAVLPSPFRSMNARGRLVTGRRAVWSGIALLAGGLLWVGINLAAAYSVITLNWEILNAAVQVLVILVFVAIGAQVISSFFGAGPGTAR